MPALSVPVTGRVRRTVIAVLVALTATACASSTQAPQTANVKPPPDLPTAAVLQPQPPATTPPPATSPTQTVAPSPDAPLPAASADPGTAPAVIDIAYLDTVMDRLDELSGEAYRSAKETGELGEIYQSRIRSVYVPQEATRQIASFERAIGVDGLADRPGDPVTAVREIISMRSDCVFFTADRDVNPLLRTPIEANQPYYLQLVPSEPNSLNEFPWALAHVSFLAPGVTPDADLCAP